MANTALMAKTHHTEINGNVSLSNEKFFNMT